MEIPIVETIRGSIYDWPKYYEFIYGSDWQAETSFLQECFKHHIDGRVHRLFEPACGTGRLIFRLAKIGTSTMKRGSRFHVSGLDLNQKAVDFCNERFRSFSLKPANPAVVGDMCDFQLPKPCDAAFNTINSFRHLETDAQAVAHLKCMAAAIRPGGIYVLGFHLTPTESEPDETESWTHRRGHLQINASMWLVDRNDDSRLEAHALAFDVYTPTKQFRIKDELRFRMYTLPQFMKLLKRVPEFSLNEVYDFAYEMERPIELDGHTQDALFVLKRK